MSRHELVRLVPERATLWDRFKRSFRIGPLSLKDPELAKYFGGGPTLSGISVNEMNVMASSAVWSAVTMIADDIASLPLMLYKRTRDGGKDRYEDHPLYSLLHDAPNPEMDAMVCWRTMQTHVLIWLNAYAEIERDGAGRPVAIWPLVPERVSMFREGGRVKYRVANPQGSDVVIGAEDMIHLVGQSHDGSVGSSWVSMARESIALGLAAEKFGASFFGNGATFGGTITYPGPKPNEMSEKGYVDKLNTRHQGVEQAYKLLALYNGGKLDRGGVPPNEGQFNETRTFQIREVARWFKMPPHKLGDLADATYSNVEQMDAAYLSSCIRPWLVLWRQQLSRKLISRLERRQQFIEHDTHGFLSVDAASRGELYSKEFRVGGLKVNEIRGFENRDPIEGGDRAFVSLDVIPLDKVDKYWDALIDNKKQPKALPAPPKQEPDPDDQADRAALRAAVEELRAALASQRGVAEQEAAEKRAALQQVEDLTGARDAMEQRSEETEAGRVDALRERDVARTELAAEQAERAREKAESDAALESKEKTTWNAAQALSEAQQELASALQLAQVNEQGAALNLEAARKAEAERDAKAAEVDVLLQRNAEAEHARIAALSAQQQAEVERDADRARLEGELAAERQALIDRTADYEERFNQLREGAEVVKQERQTAIADQLAAEAREAAAVQRAEAAERDKAIAEQAQQAANAVLSSARAAGAERSVRMLTATRALIVDAMGRIIRRETEKARRNQATPEKIRHWSSNFYVLHEETCCEILQPAVRAHLSVLGTDEQSEAVTLDIVRKHIAESVRQLESAAASEPSEFQPVLAKVLNRWETQRADALADRLLKEGVDHVRAQQ